MSTLVVATRELHCKLVYVGPGLGGKTTNVEYVYTRVAPEARGKMISLKTDSERTLFFDFLPLMLGEVSGYKVRFHLYTVPGQVHYDASRRLILKGADGVVFVADSSPARLDANMESVENIREHLGELHRDAARLPWVFQYNKRDLPEALPLEELREALQPQGAPEHAAVAAQGVGVMETLKTAARSVLLYVRGPAPRAAGGAR